MNSSIQTQWLQQREPRLIHRSVYMIKNAVGINYHYSARSREPLDGLIHRMSRDITYIDVYESTFLFPKAFFFALMRQKLSVNIKVFMNVGWSYLDVVCRTWGEVGQQRLWYVQVLIHLCEGGIWVRTHLLVPTGMEAIFQVIAFHSVSYIYEQDVTKKVQKKH